MSTQPESIQLLTRWHEWARAHGHDTGILDDTRAFLFRRPEPIPLEASYQAAVDACKAFAAEVQHLDGTAPERAATAIYAAIGKLDDAANLILPE